jgi:hypothetical protein
MSCREFNMLGSYAKTLDDVAHTDATVSQAKLVREIIADHSGDLCILSFSAKCKALKKTLKTGQATELVAGALFIARLYCFSKPNEPVQTIAFDQFDRSLDAVAKRLGY